MASLPSKSLLHAVSLIEVEPYLFLWKIDCPILLKLSMVYSFISMSSLTQFVSNHQ